MEIKPDLGKLMRREIYTLLTISSIIIISFLIIQALVVNLDPEVSNDVFVRNVWSWVAGFLILLWVVTPWFQYFWIINLKYSVKDSRLVIHKGMITKKKVSIPFSAITDFTLSRSLFERWLDIGTIYIQTAGQGVQPGAYEGKLEGIVDFDSLHSVLRLKVKASRGNQAEINGVPIESVTDEIEVLKSILEEIIQINSKME